MNKKSLLVLPILLVALTACKSEEEKTYETWSDFDGETFVTVEGTNCEDAVKALIEDPHFIYVDSPYEFSEVIKSGAAIAAITNEPNITYLAELDDDLDVYPTLLDSEDYAFLLKKGSSLTESINLALKEITDSGDLAEIIDKWIYGESPSLDANSYKVDSTETLTLAMAPDFEPCCFIDSNGKYGGYEIEIAYLVAKTLNVNLEIISTDFSSLFTDVSSGATDFATCIITVSEERKLSYDFSSAFYTGGVALLMDKEIVEPLKTEKTFNTLSDFSGATVATIGGASGVVDPAKAAIPNLNVKYYKSTEAALDALKGGRVDGLLRNKYNLEHYLEGEDDLMIFPEDIAKDYYGYMFPKDSELTSKINSALKSLGDEFISELQTKWINATEETRIDIDSYLVDSEETIRYSFAIGNEPFSYLIEEEVEESAPSIGDQSGDAGLEMPVARYLEGGDSDTTPSESLDEGTSSDTGESIVSLPAGYEVELMYAISHELGMNLEVTAVPEFRDTFTEIDTGTADVVSGGISITDERKLTYDFSSEIFEGAISIAIRKDAYSA